MSARAEPAAAAAAPELLLQTAHEGILHLTLNRPAQYNALSEELLAALRAALRAAAGDARVRVVVLSGAGKAFCAGHDLRQMQAKAAPEYFRALFADCSRLMQEIRQLPQPVIARVQGVAAAAGCQLVAACDLAVAAASARFATSGINIGLFCATPAVPLSRSIGQKQAFEMLFTGEDIDATQACARGLVNRAVPDDQLDAAVAALAARLAAKPPQVVAAGKALFYQQREMGVTAAYQLAVQAMACNLQDADTQEGIAAFLEKRTPHWGAGATPPE